MADDPINIVLTDNVDGSVQVKFQGIADTAKMADAAIKQLQSDLSKINVSGLEQLTNANTSAMNATAAQTRAQAQLQSALNKTAISEAQAALAAQKLATEQEKTTAAAIATQAAQIALQNSMNKTTTATAGLSHGSSAATTEIVRMMRALATGQFDRLAGEATVLGTRLGWLQLLFSPLGAAIALTTALFIGGAVAIASYEASLAQLQVATFGLGRQTGLTADQLGQLAQETAQAGNISVATAQGMIESYIRLGITSPQVLKSITDATLDYAAATKEKASEAVKQLGIDLADPVEGLKKLATSIGGVGPAEEDMMRKAVAANDIIAEQNILIGIIIRQTGGARAANDSLGGSFDDLGGKISSFVHTQGADLLNFLNYLNSGGHQGFTINSGKNGLSTSSDKPNSSETPQQAQANAAQDNLKKNQQAALDFYNTAAPKQSQINQLKLDEAKATNLGTQGLLNQHQVNEVIFEDNNKIAALEKTPQSKAAESRAHALDEVNNKLKEQSDLYGLVGISLASQTQFDQIEQQLLTKKITLSESEAGAIYNTIYAEQQKKAIQAESVAAYEAVNGAAVKYQQTLQGIALAQQKGPGKGNLTGSQGGALEIQANVNYNKSTTQGYDPVKDGFGTSNSTVVIAGLKTELELSTELKDVRTVDTQQQASNVSWMEQGHELDLSRSASLKQRLADSIEINKYTAAQDSLESSSLQNQEKELVLQAQAIKNLQAKGALGANEANAASFENQTKQMENALAQGSGTFNDTIMVGIRNLATGYKGILPGLGQEFTSFFGSLENTASSSLTKVFMGTEKLGDALRDVATAGIESLLQGFIKLGIQWVVSQALGKSLGAAGIAADAPLAAASAAMWAPAAVAASIATLGAADAAGSAAYATSLGTGIALTTAASAFAGGGQVFGPGGPREDKINAWLSNGEFVVNADATSKNLALLQAVNSGYSYQPAFASGGMVGSALSSSPNYTTSPSNNNNTSISPKFDFRGANFGGADPADIEKRFRKVYKEELAPATITTARQLSFADQSQYRARPSINGRKRS